MSIYFLKDCNAFNTKNTSLFQGSQNHLLICKQNVKAVPAAIWIDAKQ